MKKNLILLILLPLLAACGGNGKKLLPNVSGKAGEVLVVAEKIDWDGEVGRMLRDSLTADCPGLPQREPLYSPFNVTPANFSQMFQLHRNIIMLNINAGVNVPGIVYRSDKWAFPQIVITVNAAGRDQACELLHSEMHTILNTLEQAERNRVIANTRAYSERKLTPIVNEFTGGGNMVFPSGYSLKKKTKDFIWISYETTYIQQGFFIYKYEAAKDASQLSPGALVGRRNTILQENVPGMLDGSYMTTSFAIMPQVKYVAYKERKFAELRGLWEVEGDFMGGPFVSHSFYSRDASQMICLEAYVYAPKYDKRLYLRQVESLLYSFEWEQEKKSE